MRLTKIAANMTGFLAGLAYVDGQTLPADADVTEAAIKTFFEKTDAYADSNVATPPPHMRILTWLEAMGWHNDLCLEQMKRLWRHVRYLDPELMRLLESIEDSPHIEGVRDYLGYIARGTTPEAATLHAWYRNYWVHYQLAQQLLAYRDRFKKAAAI